MGLSSKGDFYPIPPRQAWEIAAPCDQDGIPEQ